VVDDSVSATAVVDAPVSSVFAVLADPVAHAAIDGTGWVTEAVDAARLTRSGQLFRMSMFHADHPDGRYETVNRVEAFEPPNAISWATGYLDDDGTLQFGGWVWRYDLAPSGSAVTTVTLTYDWSATSEPTRARIGFPPFPPEHLTRSLAHLAALATSTT